MLKWNSEQSTRKRWTEIIRLSMIGIDMRKNILIRAFNSIGSQITNDEKKMGKCDI